MRDLLTFNSYQSEGMLQTKIIINISTIIEFTNTLDTTFYGFSTRMQEKMGIIDLRLFTPSYLKPG